MRQLKKIDDDNSPTKKTSRVPWKAIAKAAPWVVWGLVALAFVLKMQDISHDDLKTIAELLMRLARGAN